MYQTKNLGLNITEMPKDTNMAFSFHTDLGYNFEAIDSKTVTHRNISNCILEIPQRIKYTLIDGTLTIKAGSVVIVPYGTVDRTSEFSVGATFLNDNFKVYDTQFTNNKFFVWVELQNDISAARNSSDNYTRLLSIYVNTASLGAAVYHNSGTTSPSGNSLFYNTDTNIIDYYTAGVADGNISSFPLGEVVAVNPVVFSSVKSIFNGFGYIGSTVWIDKDVKILAPNGTNEDGSLKSVEFISSTIKTETASSSYSNTAATLVLSQQGQIGLYNYTESDEIPTTSGYGWVYHRPSNYTYYWDNASSKYILNGSGVVPLTYANVTAGTINSISPKKPFRALDYNDYQSKITELEAKIEALQAAVKALQG